MIEPKLPEDREKTIDRLWEASDYETQREDVARAYDAGVAAERERSPLVLVNGLVQTEPESDVPMVLAVNASANALSYVDDWGPDGVSRVEIQPGGFVWVRRRKGV